MQKLKVNDEVIVIAGKDKNKKGKVKSINFKTNRVVVEGLNMFKKALKPTQANPNGGITDIEKGIHISNVAVASPKSGKVTKVKVVLKNNKNVRVAKKCGSDLK
jgi:large subunit ribosomal protein L24